MTDLTSIHERLARIETTQSHQSDILDKIDGKLDGISERVRDMELKSATYGSLAGIVVSGAVALISAKLNGLS